MHSLTTLRHLHLKYCERCAGLWLRPDGDTIPYCPACRPFMAVLPLRNLRNQRKPVRRSLVRAMGSLLALLTGWWV